MMSGHCRIANMPLTPLPPELAERDEVRAPPGFGILLALGMSLPFWVVVALFWR
jgi:hypothetical protein